MTNFNLHLLCFFGIQADQRAAFAPRRNTVGVISAGSSETHTCVDQRLSASGHLFRRALTVCLLLFAAHPVSGQRPETSPVQVGGLLPNGGRATLTDSWGSLAVEFTNPEPIARTIRLVVFHAERPDVQYGRDFWVPGKSRINSWMTIGPPPSEPGSTSRELKYVLYDMTDGEPRRLAAPGDEPVRSKLAIYRKREPTTAVIVDRSLSEPFAPEPLTDPHSPASEAVVFARAFRQARSFSELIAIFGDAFIPSAEGALDGVDHLVLASNRIIDDPAGARALRHWVEHGGALWVLLDMVEPRTVAAILGEDLGFAVVGRTTLTSVQILQPWEGPEAGGRREFDDPVPFVRVALDGSETVLLQVDGWPAAFTKPVGRGRVLFTTLAGRAWHRPREAKDETLPTNPPPKGPVTNIPNLPTALRSLNRLAIELEPTDRDAGGIQAEDLEPLLRAEIGYSVIGRPTVVVVLGGFAVSLLAIGWLVRRSRRPGAAGWLVPAAAVAAAGILVGLGSSRRQAVPPTVGTVAVIDAVPPNGEGTLSGLFAVYRPSPGSTHLAAEHGGNVDLDMAGLEGEARRRMMTDIDNWHWDGLALPAGVRTGPVRSTIETGDLSVVARFGPNGLEGKLKRGPFKALTEALLLTEAREPVGIRLRDDVLTSSVGDGLSRGQFLTDAVLTDRQQRRQEVYRRLFSRPLPRYLEGRTVLYGWTDLDRPPLDGEPGSRTLAEAVVAIPVEFERPEVGGKVTIPAGFIPYSAIIQGRPARPRLEASLSSSMVLGFRLPPSVLPFTIERATLRARVHTPSRRFSVAGYAADDQPTTLRAVESPIDPVEVTITDPRMLRLDADGFLHIGIEVSGRVGGEADPGIVQLDDTWRIESLTLEVIGRAEARK
jgi:hypothetical protein